MADECVDPADAIVLAHMQALREAFDPESNCPPSGGGGTTVRFFAGDAIPMAAWEVHSVGRSTSKVIEPFLWVRVMRRFRSTEFPDAAVDIRPCSGMRVIELEMGVARCAVAEAEPRWDDYANEAAVSLDDSWRIELAQCRVSSLLRDAGNMTGLMDVQPYGPEGGLVAWTGGTVVQF